MTKIILTYWKDIGIILFAVGVLAVVFKSLKSMGKKKVENKQEMEDFDFDAYHREIKKKVS